jgi:hypothetical protein
VPYPPVFVGSRSSSLSSLSSYKLSGSDISETPQFSDVPRRERALLRKQRGETYTKKGGNQTKKRPELSRDSGLATGFKDLFSPYHSPSLQRMSDNLRIW